MNGDVVTQLGTRVDPLHDVVAVDGVLIVRPTTQTLMLNKPIGYISTCKDPHARDTVMTLLPTVPGLHPIGRLDKDTTGLLLLTNDGDLTFALTHPRHQVEKTYQAWVNGIPTPETLEHLRAGVLLSDGMTAPARVRLLQHLDQRAQLELTIHEGRKRQVRRMLLAVGHLVLTLTRVRIGPLTLGALPEGDWRALTPAEVAALFAASGAVE